MVNVRDINLICQYYKTYAQIEGRTRRRKITRARRRNGILEVRTASRDEWVQPVAWIEWVNDLGPPFGIWLRIFAERAFFLTEERGDNWKER